MSILNNLIKTITLLILGVVIFGGVQVGVTHAATPKQTIQGGVNEVTGDPGAASKADSNIEATVKTAINVLSLFAGAIAVVVLMIGGFRYVTSGGKQESVASAKSTIVYALIGLVIVAVAQIVVHFVLNNTNNAIAGGGTSSASPSGGGSSGPSCVGGTLPSGKPC